LAIDGDAGRVMVPQGAFLTGVSSAVPVAMQRAAAGPAGFAPAAYPPLLARALAAAPPSASPLSAFYNFVLAPAVSAQLARPAQVSLSYSSGAAPGTLNVYWYNPAANAYVLQTDVTGAPPVVNTSNRTITINVNHLATYVLLSAATPVIGGSAFAGGDVEAFNFPNPFNLQPKTISSIHGAGTQTVRGTMIRVALPPSLSGDVSLRIFTVSGERVRTIDLGALQGGAYYYQPWDGTNDFGRDVASGVYIAEIKAAGKSTFFKMAVIK
jgi:hypothetical protein